MSPGRQTRLAPLRRSRIISLPIRRAHISATASASASRCCSALALPFSSATATSSAATHRASPRSCVERIERGEARLPFARQQRLEALVHIGEDRRAGAEVGRDRQDAVGILGEKRIACPHIGADVSAAETIDRLLGIADQEQRAGTDLEGRPISRSYRLQAVRRRAARRSRSAADRCPGTRRRGHGRNAPPARGEHHRGRAAGRAPQRSGRRNRAGPLERL